MFNNFNAKILAKSLQRLIRNPSEVLTAAKAARKIGKPYAAKDLADIVERLALVKGNKAFTKVNENKKFLENVELGVK